MSYWDNPAWCRLKRAERDRQRQRERYRDVPSPTRSRNCSWGKEHDLLLFLEIRLPWELSDRTWRTEQCPVQPEGPWWSSDVGLVLRLSSVLWSYCQVLPFPQSQCSKGGTLRCQITPGGPTPRLLVRVLKGVLTEPLPGAGAPTDPQSRRS